jgi:hypothetical protein
MNICPSTGRQQYIQNMSVIAYLPNNKNTIINTTTTFAHRRYVFQPTSPLRCCSTTITTTNYIKALNITPRSSASSNTKKQTNSNGRKWAIVQTNVQIMI